MCKLQKQLDQYKSMLPPPGLPTPLFPVDWEPPRPPPPPPPPPTHTHTTRTKWCIMYKWQFHLRGINLIHRLSVIYLVCIRHVLACNQEMGCSYPEKTYSRFSLADWGQPVTPIHSTSIGYANSGFWALLQCMRRHIAVLIVLSCPQTLITFAEKQSPLECN